MTPTWAASEAAGRPVAGAPGKTPFVAAVETNDRGHPQRMKLTVVNGFRSVELAAWARQHLCEGSRVLSDGLACFHAVTDARCSHDRVVTGGGGGGGGGGRACQCAASRVSLGQYDSGERQERASQHVSLLSPQVCTALPLGVRISVQSPVSSARTHSQACLRGAQNSADAGKATQTRRSLSGNQVVQPPAPEPGLPPTSPPRKSANGSISWRTLVWNKTVPRPSTALAGAPAIPRSGIAKRPRQRSPLAASRAVMYSLRRLTGMMVHGQPAAASIGPG